MTDNTLLAVFAVVVFNTAAWTYLLTSAFEDLRKEVLASQKPTKKRGKK